MSRHIASELGDGGMEARESIRTKQAAAEDNTASPMPIGTWRTLCGDVVFDDEFYGGDPISGVDVTTYNADVGSRAAVSPSAGLARSITDLDALLSGIQSPPAALARNITNVAGLSSPLGALHSPSSSKLAICSPVASVRGKHTLLKLSSGAASPLRISSPGLHPSSPRVRSPCVRVSSPLAGTLREARRERASSLRDASPIRKTFSRVEFAKTSHALRRQSETGIQLLMQLRMSLVRQLDTSENVLAKGTQMMKECGQAIATWFGALSGPALEAAIKEAFEKFDADRSGMIDRQEFEQAMATLGLRLTADEFSELLEKFDADKSGDIDIDEFLHMIKCHLKKACNDTCPVCLRDGGSNLLRAYLRKRWADDDSKWAPAASTLQAFVNSKLFSASYAPVVQEKAAASTLQAFVASKPTRDTYISTIQEERQKKPPTPPPVSVQAEFEARWDEDESKWAPAASTLKAFVNAMTVYAPYAQVVREKIDEEVAEDALNATTAAILQQVFIEAQEVVVQEVIEEEEEVVVVPRTCGAYTWDFRKDTFPSAKPIRTRTHPFIRRYGLSTATNSVQTRQLPPLSPSDFSYHHFSPTSSTSLPTNPFKWTSTSDPANFGRRQSSSPTRRNIPTATPRSYPSPPASDRAALRSPGWSTSPRTRRRNESARSSSGALTDRQGLRTQTSSLLNSTAKAHASQKCKRDQFILQKEPIHLAKATSSTAKTHASQKTRSLTPNGDKGVCDRVSHCDIHWEKCAKIEARLRKLTKLRYASNSRSLYFCIKALFLL
jgi:hypothetical protein